MRKKFYLPLRENQRTMWLHNFNDKLPGYATQLNITSGELTKLDKMYKYYKSLIGQLDSLRAAIKAATGHKDFFCDSTASLPLDDFPNFTVSLAPKPAEAGLWAFVSSLVNRIKATPGYSEDIGKNLGIIGHVPEFDRRTYKPKITSAKVLHGPEVRIRYKKGLIDRMFFYCRTNGGAWEKRGYNSSPPYHDLTPLAVAGVPEKREYQCMAIISDEEIGVPSDITIVIVG